ncbi:MAG: OmpP1/FadL family transporter [Lutibacter sp.]
MRNLYFLAIFFIAFISNAQTLSYNDIGVLFAHQQINGTARYNAMSGAFGALGGDLSAIEVNPAGAAVFINSEFAVSLNNRNEQINSNYYGNNELTENDYTNLNQGGGVFVFKNFGRNQGWENVAIGFNYSISNDFENQWFANGNSNFPTYIQDPNDSNLQYLNSTNQHFENYTSGKTNKYSFTIASKLNDNMYIGAAVNTYDVNHYQQILLEEDNNDGNGNNLNASLIQELSTYGDGFSFNFGLISKPNDNMRLGIAYESPTWYRLSEDYVDSDLELYVSNTDETFTDNSGVNSFDYRLRTPSKLTGSFAYIFDKQGLISVDYAIKDYSNITLTNANFSSENQAFKSDLKSVGELRIGTEWRFENLSLRGGYHFQKNPYKDALTSDNFEGFSLGAGFKFKGGRVDISYQKDSYTKPYDFYPQYNEVNSADLNIDRTKLAATLVLSL